MRNFVLRKRIFSKEITKKRMKMNKIVMLAMAVMALVSCSGSLGELSADYFKVNPNPLEAEAGQVEATINGLFPEQYMQKKAVVKVTPELRYVKDGQQLIAKGQSATFQGEKVMGNDQTVNYKLGGQYTMKTRFAYEQAMENSELWLTFDAMLGSKPVNVPAVKVADGVIATSELYHQTLASAQPAMATDAFRRVIALKQEANIKFLIQQAELRKAELKNNSVQEFVSLLQRISNDRDRLNLKNVEVSAYASPDGGFALNEKLANERQDNTEEYVREQLATAGIDGSVETSFTAQDWEGFQRLVAASDIPDKDVIIRVLSMYKDPQEREQQIRNLSHGFQELADGILPELRRARLTINYETVGRSDQQIAEQLKSDPSQLSVEELLYAATIAKTDAEKESIYRTTTQVYPNDSRAWNNLAAMVYAKGDYDESQRLLEKARSLNANSAEVNANLGLLALQRGDTKAAETLIARAASADNVGETKGNLHLAQGNYALAEKDFEGINSNSAALAQIMNKNYAKAARTLKQVANPDGMTDYLQAIVSARQGNNDAAASFLRSAIQKDPSLKQYAANDLELKDVAK
jgi:Flp pilus assembly protein TadD